MLFDRRKRRTFVVHFDGAIGRDGRATGLGVIVRDKEGRILKWLCGKRGPLNSNEAEYAALVFALEHITRLRPYAVHFYSDNEVVVNQMKGVFAVRSPSLRRWHTRACRLARLIPYVTFNHIPRERNLLADALATEALNGWVPLTEEKDVRGGKLRYPR